MEQEQALPWFRTYTKMVDDEKLRLLAFEDRWHFMAILCLKGQGILDAADPLMMRKAAVKMGLDMRTLEEVARRIAEVGLIEQATLQPVSWNKLQQRSDADSTAAERKRRQRQREREELDAAKRANELAQHAAAEAAEAKQAGHTDVTDVSRVTVTPPSRVTRHEVTRTDIDIDKDTESQLSVLLTEGGESSPNAAPAAPPNESAEGGQPAADDPAAAPAPPPEDPKPEKAPKARNGARLPDDWKLPKKWGDWALGEYPALAQEDVRNQADMFADHWRAKAGHDARKLDWQATWRNWMRRFMEGKHTGKPGSQPGAAGAGIHRPPRGPTPGKYEGAAKAIYGGFEP